MRGLTPTILLALSPPLPLAAEAALALGYGVGHRYDDETRHLTSSDGFEYLDGGQHILLGFSAPERGFVGFPWIDFDWIHDSGNGARLDTLGIIYAERLPIWRGWLGAGVGSAYHDLNLNGRGRSQNWRFAAKACAGLTLFDPVYVEAAYVYGGSSEGYDMDYFTLDIGLRF